MQLRKRNAQQSSINRQTQKRPRVCILFTLSLVHNLRVHRLLAWVQQSFSKLLQFAEGWVWRGWVRASSSSWLAIELLEPRTIGWCTRQVVIYFPKVSDSNHLSLVSYNDLLDIYQQEGSYPQCSRCSFHFHSMDLIVGSCISVLTLNISIYHSSHQSLFIPCSFCCCRKRWVASNSKISFVACSKTLVCSISAERMLCL